MKATLTYDNKKLPLHLNKSTISDELYVIFEEEQTPQYRRLKLSINPKQDVVLQDLSIQLPLKLAATDNVFCNGFQTWSESRLYDFNEQPDSLRSFAKPLMGFYGDYHFPKTFLPRQKGLLHSWTYGYVQHNSQLQTHNSQFTFFGSLSEETAFTLLLFDIDNQSVTIKKDLSNLTLSHSFAALDLVIISAKNTPSVFQQYFDLQNLSKIQKPVATGWTSWYNYYNKISEPIISQNLAEFKSKNLPIDYFQIDDGWQTRVGDWLSVKSEFPNGMKALADNIHSAGFKAGLWLAPFVVEAKSRIFSEKPDWILRGVNGKPLAVGYAPIWSGKFYALDIYNKNVQDYLAGVFLTVLQTWGFDMVKLDFLYAACVLPRKNKTRGQVMHDAMEFLRSLIGEKTMLACGVPLGSAFGLADFCRIGADIHLSWEHRLLKFLRNRERVSTIVALRTVLGRWELNGRAFQSDPDVFLLREKNIQLTENERLTILILNTLLGDLLFTSDFIGDYTEGVLSQFKGIFEFKNRIVERVEQLEKDIFTIHFSLNNEPLIAYCNLTNSVISKPILLKAHETQIWHWAENRQVRFEQPLLS